MDIKTSLIIEEQNIGAINMIIAGSFVRIYNQSFYLLTQQLGKVLKPIVGNIKSADNRFIIYGGFPIRQIPFEYPKAVKQNWGFQLTDVFELDGYDEWFARWEGLARR